MHTQYARRIHITRVKAWLLDDVFPSGNRVINIPTCVSFDNLQERGWTVYLPESEGWGDHGVTKGSS